ncbi:MAG: hypothetical protein JKY52_06500 [Flavobacteriales bacterium]|nr:hypothetical protein [Flavobacteriales bacterium]
MSSVRIERIFGASLEAGQSMELQYVPNGNQARAVGLLFTSNMDLSISFDNSTDLKFHQNVSGNAPHFSPDSRIVKTSVDLNRQVIRGMVVSRTKQRANVYLIIESR